MRNILPVIVALIFIYTTANAQENNCDLKLSNSESDKIVIDNATGINRYQGKSLEGNVCVYYASGKLWREMTYIKGKQEGISKVYLESGKLFVEAPYEKGKQEGIYKSYYESGKLKYELSYKNGKKEGISKNYFESGKLKSELPFKNGKVEGLGKGYSESGKLRYEMPYKKGKKEGNVKHYRENGKLWQTFIAKDDKYVSGTCYNSNGSQVPLTGAEITKLNNGFDVICK